MNNFKSSKHQTKIGLIVCRLTKEWNKWNCLERKYICFLWIVHKWRHLRTTLLLNQSKRRVYSIDDFFHPFIRPHPQPPPPSFAPSCYYFYYCINAFQSFFCCSYYLSMEECERRDRERGMLRNNFSERIIPKFPHVFKSL